MALLNTLSRGEPITSVAARISVKGIRSLIASNIAVLLEMLKEES